MSSPPIEDQLLEAMQDCKNVPSTKPPPHKQLCPSLNPFESSLMKSIKEHEPDVWGVADVTSLTFDGKPVDPSTVKQFLMEHPEAPLGSYTVLNDENTMECVCVPHRSEAKVDISSRSRAFKKNNISLKPL